MLSKQQIQLVVGQLPAQFISKVEEVSEAIEIPLTFCVDRLVQDCDGAKICPHMAYIDALSSYESIAELTPKLLQRYGFDALLSPVSQAVDQTSVVWQLSERDAIYFEAVGEFRLA